MTISFTCTECGSLLKIKDHLAGTDGKCPKCKAEFVVPEPTLDNDSAEILVLPSQPVRTSVKPEKAMETIVKRDVDLTHAHASEHADRVKAPQKLKTPASDNFDPADFLMGGQDSVKVKPHSTPASSAVSDPEMAPARRNTEERPSKPAGKSSATMSTRTESEKGVNASTHAKDMITKAMEESRLHAGDPPPEEPKEGFDFGGFFREVGLKGGAGVVVFAVLLVGTYMLFDYMMGGRLKLPKLGYVTGVVKLDGAPLPGATVYFAPLDATMADSKRDRARTSFGITDAKGAYKMMYLQGTPGVAVGKCRIWLDLVGPKGQVIPPDYTEAVMQVRDVKPGSQEYSFEMRSTP
jgi:hypothetical protein